ncbi:alanine--tRNA ligase [Christensenella minuta]|uniref:Alanine--tRNA ligase n=1 Tax=Christensenella minuta TaxID=626937 RepID=A0A136Q3U9_9FIRM|nr:alanine--tRNA ligase [Christensenella minuta]AYH39989.1 alanine--tRNA ligase [Christensenella minuta]KXK65339.1 alanine--tRNA ligase [Christensenella minuta]MDY3752132.1 alanine--tRNA ligase [Christensenella minuta]
MKCLTSDELRQMYLDFFKSKGHAVIKSASLIPENDPTVLFTTAGMHPLVPYLLGETHPAGTRLTDVQKCVRTGDIDEVGDESHCTFFEMLGNWSLGDYFKKEAITWSFEFLTDEKYLGIDKDKLYFSCFAGDEDAPRDTVAYDTWRSLGVAEDHIFFLPKENNWWGPAGITGPCGPDTEMFIDTGKPACGPDCSPACGCGKYLEIWNDVFMEYNKQADGTYVPLEQKNVDTGMGLDRTIAILQGKGSVYETDVFAPIIAKIEELSGKKYEGADEDTRKAFRIVADHVRCATFMIGDERGITPSNVDQGYVLRRLLRRAIRFSGKLGIAEGSLPAIAKVVIDKYAHAYEELRFNENKILAEIAKEEERFQKTITQGLKEFEKTVERLEGDTIDGKSAFRLYDTFGFPIEFTLELAAERGLKVDKEGFDKAFEHHQELSHAGAEQRFKGGLADTSEQTARLHTATHLLNAALRKLLSEDIVQKGSNITAERLRFDFNFPRKVERDELDQLEAYVNEAIAAGLDVIEEEMSVEEAKQQGAMGVFDSKYGDLVKVYTIPGYSKEICGGPHAKNTAELGHFKIKKEQSSSAGVRRIKAVLD